MKTIKPIILAGGKGVRMKSDGPKVLVPLRGKPMISYLLGAVDSAGLAETPIIVIGYGGGESEVSACNRNIIILFRKNNSALAMPLQPLSLISQVKIAT